MASPLGLVFTNESSGLQTINTGGVNKNYRVVDGKAVKSIFDNGQFSPYPATYNVSSGSVDKMRFAADIHNDEANDLDTNSIIKYCLRYPSMKLDYSHFAYLKDLGVYPNNRLVIARRFSGGVGNDLTSIATPAMATLVSWMPESEENFFSIKFNEEYTDADGSFEEVLNELGEEVIASRDNKGAQLGKMVSQAFNIIPLPGLMEGVQQEIMKKMGISSFGMGSSPEGNPNLIRQAKRRATPDKGQAGSALNASFEVKMDVEYEQKFINGVDPTLVYLDIIQNALTFGTSDAVFTYTSAFATGVSDLIRNLISGDVQAIAKGIYEFVGNLISAIGTVVGELAQKLIEPEDEGDDEKITASQVVSAFLGVFTQATVGHIVQKYKVRLLGITNALTGAPSTPWHITIGNPKKPIFSSGDMQCTSVDLSLGKVLAFNDLPSSIKLSISFQNARNLGAQEIFNRFNTGKGRSYVRLTKAFEEQSGHVLTDKEKAELDKKINDGKTETQTTPTGGTPSQQSAAIPDDYPVKFTDPNAGVEWGLAQSQPPAANTTQTGDATTAGATGSGAKPSNQSANDPNTTTSGVSPANNTQQTETQNPGGTASTIQSQNTPAQTTPPEEWVPGKKVNSGSYNQQRIRVEWKVVQGEKKGDYVVSWESSGGVYGDKKFFSADGLTGSFVPNPDAGKPIPVTSDEFETTGTRESATDEVRIEAKDEFESRLRQAGFKPIGDNIARVGGVE